MVKTINISLSSSHRFFDVVYYYFCRRMACVVHAERVSTTYIIARWMRPDDVCNGYVIRACQMVSFSKVQSICCSPIHFSLSRLPLFFFFFVLFSLSFPSFLPVLAFQWVVLMNPSGTLESKICGSTGDRLPRLVMEFTSIYTWCLSASVSVLWRWLSIDHWY